MIWGKEERKNNMTMREREVYIDKPDISVKNDPKSGSESDRSMISDFLLKNFTPPPMR